MRIGFFDSGVGGITVLHQALTQMPRENYIYFGDMAHVPYGTKNKETVKKYILEAVAFLVGEGIKALVVACNTATSIAITELRARYGFPILGMEPAVKPAIEKNGSQRILVTATPLTLREEKYHNLVTRLDQDHLVDCIALPELVDYAENFILDKEVITAYLKEKLSAHDLSAYGTVVLGCTHFAFYRNCFQEMFPAADIIDGNKGTINYLQKILLEKNLCEQNQGDILFYSSGGKKLEPEYFRKYLDYLKKEARPAEQVG